MTSAACGSARRVFACFAVAACVCLAVNPLAAQSEPDPHAVQPERPTVATHAGTVATGWLELEFGGEYDRFADQSRATLVPIVFKIGVAPCLQLNVQTPASTGSHGTGFDDVSAGLKWRILDRAPVLGDFAVLPSVKLPTGSTDAGTGTGTTDVGLLIISSHDVRGVDMDLNVGYTRRNHDGSIAPTSTWVWTASFGGALQGELGWVGELFGYPATSGPAGSRSSVAILAGPTVLVRPWLALDVGAIARIAGPQPNAFYVGGVYNVGRLRKRS